MLPPVGDEQGATGGDDMPALACQSRRSGGLGADTSLLKGPPSTRGLTAMLSDPARRTTERYARTYLGSGRYRCGVCDGPLTGNTTAGGGPGGRKAAYRCRTADRDGSSHVVRDVEQVDAFVVAVLCQRLLLPDAVDALDAAAPDLAPLHEEAAALRARLDEVARGWAAGALTQAQLLAASAELRDRLEAIERRIGQASQISVLSGLAGLPDMDARWAGLSLDRRRAVLDALVLVTVLPRAHAGRLPGGSYFDRSAVQFDWRRC